MLPLEIGALPSAIVVGDDFNVAGANIDVGMGRVDGMLGDIRKARLEALFAPRNCGEVGHLVQQVSQLKVLGQ
ncbi:hypothetical protein NMA58_29935 (plasmid) [Rhizobium sp. YTUHZ045]|uniref:hypothetical protein n=1 Tax=Rhizobium TaxID=379 RepID=UPI0039F69B41